MMERPPRAGAGPYRDALGAPGIPGLRFHLEKESQTRRAVMLTVPARVFEEAVQDHLREIRKRARVRGFRKGRVPRERIESLYGEDATERAATDLIERAMKESLAQLDLKPLGTPEVTIQNGVRGRALTGRLTMSVLPQIGPVEFEGIEATPRETSVTESDIGETLEELRRDQAPLQPIGGREIRDDDIVVGDLQETETAHPDASPRLTRGLALQVGTGAYHEALHEALQGASLGDTVVATARFGNESPDPERAGRAIRASFTIREATARVLPPLDDEFARRLGAASLLALRGDIRDRLRTRARADDRQALEDQLLVALRERNPIEAPAPLVERELDYRVRTFLAEMIRSGADPERARARIERDLPALRARCESTIANAILLDELAEQEGIEASEEAVEDRIRKEAEARGKSPAALRAALEKDGALSGIRNLVRRKATIALLRERAAIARSAGNEPS